MTIRSSLAILAVFMWTGTSGCEPPDSSSTSGSESASSPSEKEAAASNETPEPEAPSSSSRGRPDRPEDLAPGETGQYGSDFQLETDPVSLATAIERYDTSKDESAAGPYKVEARIDKVCQKKGCWFTLTDEAIDRSIRVRMKDYGFFVPRNVDGAEAIVEGRLDTRTLSEEERRHYARDRGQDPSTIEAPRQRYEFTATAVRIKMDS